MLCDTEILQLPSGSEPSHLDLCSLLHWKTAGRFIFQRAGALASNLLLERIKELKKSIRRLSKHAHSSISRKVVLEELQEDMLASQACGLWKAKGRVRGVVWRWITPSEWSTLIFLLFTGSQTAPCFTHLMDDFTVEIGVDARLLAKPAD